MDAKEAVSLAKRHILDLFSEEPIADVGLEEVRFDREQGQWLVTIGFSRRWGGLGDAAPSGLAAALRAMNRTYKVVTLQDADGALAGVSDRVSLAMS